MVATESKENWRGSDWTVLGTVGSEATSFDDDSVGRGKDYDYRLVAINGFDSVMSSSAQIQSLRSSLANIATRGMIGSGAEALILGFVIEGTGPIDILATAKGPDLANVGISNFALDPTISLFPFGAADPDAQSDDWGADAATISDFVDHSLKLLSMIHRKMQPWHSALRVRSFSPLL